MKLTGNQIKSIILFSTFLLIILVLFNRLTPFIYRSFPNDYGRTRLIGEILCDSSKRPEIVIFGNSRGMSGIDGYKLEKELKGNPIVYNLTSTGQQLSESILHYSSLPSSVKKIIQCVDIDQLSTPITINIPNRVALHMYGYEMDSVTRYLLPQLYDIMDYSDFRYNYEARNSLFMGLSSVLRNLLDDDVVSSAIENELHYPNSSLSDRNDVIYQRDIKEQNKVKKLQSFHICKEWSILLTNTYRLLQQRGITLYLVIMPYNPDIKSISDSDKSEAVQIVLDEFKYLSIINCIDLLDPSDFYDAIHPNHKGAIKITDQIISFDNSYFSNNTFF